MRLATLIACGGCRLALPEQHVIFRHQVAHDSHDVLSVDAGMALPTAQPHQRCNPRDGGVTP